MTTAKLVRDRIPEMGRQRRTGVGAMTAELIAAVVKLRAAGLTGGEIAARLNIPRHRAWRIWRAAEGRPVRREAWRGHPRARERYLIRRGCIP